MPAKDPIRQMRSYRTCWLPAEEKPLRAPPRESGAYVPEMAARIDDDRNLTDGARRCARKLAKYVYRAPGMHESSREASSPSRRCVLAPQSAPLELAVAQSETMPAYLDHLNVYCPGLCPDKPWTSTTGPHTLALLLRAQ